MSQSLSQSINQSIILIKVEADGRVLHRKPETSLVIFCLLDWRLSDNRRKETIHF